MINPAEHVTFCDPEIDPNGYIRDVMAHVGFIIFDALPERAKVAARVKLMSGELRVDCSLPMVTVLMPVVR